MGLLSFLTGAKGAGLAAGVAEVGRVFAGDAAARERFAADALASAQAGAGAEYARAPVGILGALADFLTRLPRPLLALGVIGLFVFAMWEPVGFAARMVGLSQIPDPLWWIMGGVVSFYFGAREFEKSRGARVQTAAEVRGVVQTIRDIEAIRAPAPVDVTQAAAEAAAGGGNAALDDWRANGGSADE